MKKYFVALQPWDELFMASLRDIFVIAGRWSDDSMGLAPENWHTSDGVFVKTRSIRKTAIPVSSVWVGEEHSFCRSRLPNKSFNVVPYRLVKSPLKQSECLALKFPSSTTLLGKADFSEVSNRL